MILYSLSYYCVRICFMYIHDDKIQMKRSMENFEFSDVYQILNMNEISDVD